VSFRFLGADVSASVSAHSSWISDAVGAEALHGLISVSSCVMWMITPPKTARHSFCNNHWSLDRKGFEDDERYRVGNWLQGDARNKPTVRPEDQSEYRAVIMHNHQHAVTDIG